VSSCFCRLGDSLVEAAEDLVFADDDGSVVERERGNALGTRGLQKLEAVGLLDRHLVDDVCEPEFGQSLPDAPRSWTPFGLPQLEHQE
jgi:hypothetical protein